MPFKGCPCDGKSKSGYPPTDSSTAKRSHDRSELFTSPILGNGRLSRKVDPLRHCRKAGVAPDRIEQGVDQQSIETRVVDGKATLEG